MKIIQVKDLAIPEVKIIRFQRFKDERGYFTEIYRQTDFDQLEFMRGVKFSQCNESASVKGVVRGLHFQYHPYMGKLVRVLSGRMVDLALDIRPDSTSFGQMVAYEMVADPERDDDEWIWLPVGLAHGNVYLEDSRIEYFCTGQYNPAGEIGIKLQCQAIDWSLVEPDLKQSIDQVLKSQPAQSNRDQQGLSLDQWQKHSAAELFSQLKDQTGL